MPKVRWTTTCAGGCGTTLSVGTQAHRLHGTWWCGPCLNRHRPTCQVLTASATTAAGNRIQSKGAAGPK